MKHPVDPIAEPWASQIISLNGGPLPRGAADALAGYVTWLGEEAVPAGAIGPDEMERIWPRHIVDALAYASVIPTGGGTGLDVGSGAGLPGIPLALVRPGIEWTLLDRSGRRCRLLRRAVRILGLGNVTVVEADVDDLDGEFDPIVMRAALPPDQAFSRAARLLSATGTGIIGLSRRAAPDATGLAEKAADHGLTADVVTIGTDVLDSPAWLLRITPRDHLS